MPHSTPNPAARGRDAGAGSGAMPWAERAAYAVAVLAYLVMCLRQPIAVTYVLAADDGFFMRSAAYLVDGQWWGPFDQYTLIKGPGYIYFLAASHFTGLPITITQGLFWIAACFFIVWVLGELGLNSRAARLALFLVLLFQPTVFPLRIVRDNIYYVLVVVAFGGLLLAALHHRRRVQIIGGLIGGFFTGWFWITREEGVWILPTVGLLFVILLWRSARQKRLLSTGAVVLAGFLATAMVAPLATSAINQRVYGIFAVQTFTAPGMQSAVNALDSIQTPTEIRQVPAPRDAIEEAVRVSPTMRELYPYLNDPALQVWYDASCQANVDACGQIAGGWLTWALQHAAVIGGKYTSATDVEEFFGRIGTEINDACESGELTCRSSPVPVLPVLTEDALRAYPTSVRGAIEITVGRGVALTNQPTPSISEPDDLKRMQELLNHPRITSIPPGEPRLDSPLWWRVRTVMNTVNAWVSLPALVVGLLAWVGSVALTATRRRAGSSMLVVATMAWLLYATRIALVALVDATSFPALHVIYLQPAIPLMWIAIFTSLAAAVHAVRSRRRPVDHESEPLGDDSSADEPDRVSAGKVDL